MRTKLVLAAAVWLLSTPSYAADHQDGPAATASPAADITDVFAWMSADHTKMYLVMDVFPAATTAAKFDTNVLYVFHATSKASILATTGSSVDVICKFDAAQAISCWAADELVTGATAGAPTTGIASASGKLKVWAGLRDDPFFFNLDGFKKLVTTVKGAAGALLPTVDASGCPKVDSMTSGVLVNQLKQDPNGGAPVDHFAGLNVLALVVSIDASLLTKGGPIVGVWASTNKPGQ
ncbi:MAG: hypothetical protein JWN44_4812 [Myxococcales bacterium]|nr:hypothetical protein [Myxococcales bacterium]